jgi:hypothetical protein
VPLLAIVAALIACSGGTATAAPPGFTEFRLTPSTTQAGGHPDLELKAEWGVEFGPCPEPCRQMSRFKSHAPAGLIANPHVAPRCTAEEFSSQRCPIDSQIGIVVSVAFGKVMLPLYSLETRPDQAGLLGFFLPVVNAPVFLEFSGRTDSDYGLDTVSTPLLRIGIPETQTIFWGVPASPQHDFQRFITPLSGTAGCFDVANGCPGTTFAEASVPEAPFLSNPTRCGVPLTAKIEGEYYGGIEVHAEAPYPETTGCSQLSFDPSQTTKPTTTAADTPSGVDVDLQVPQPQSPTTPSPSQLRTNRLTLPEGFSINPGAADGKVACSDAHTSLGTLFAANCPEFSKVGTTEIDSSALPGPIFGALYLAEPKPGDPYRLLLTGDGFATHVKVLASVRPDPQTGRITTVFEDLPETPVQRINLHIFGSERGLLATPERCDTYEVENEFVPWNAALTTRTATSFVTIDSGPNGSPCPGGARKFAPRLAGGSSNSTAGEYAPFRFVLERDDGDQNLTAVSVRTPQGFVASLAGVPYCPEAAIALISSPGYSGRTEQASSACPPASRVGAAVAGAGAGAHPLYTGGTVYLAGPYRGAPLSLVVVIPAVSGPYDLGNVAVRVAIHVDPTTAQVSASSDPLPQILEGIPLRTRYVRIDLDRPSFSLNPTNCRPASVEAVASGDEGAASSLSHHFQVANCNELPFEPKLTFRFTGGTNRSGHPAIHAVLSTDPDEANVRRTRVTLPKGQLLDNSHIETVCTRPDFAQDACPSGALVGHAEAATPLLDQPLRGPIYLRSSNNNLPDLAFDLEGQIDVETSARIDSIKGRLRATFQSIPDVPLGRVSIHLRGGSKGLLLNTSDLCGTRRRALARIVGQNGAKLTRRPRLRVACGTKRSRKRNVGHDRSRRERRAP